MTSLTLPALASISDDELRVRLRRAADTFDPDELTLDDKQRVSGILLGIASRQVLLETVAALCAPDDLLKALLARVSET